MVFAQMSMCWPLKEESCSPDADGCVFGRKRQESSRTLKDNWFMSEKCRRINCIFHVCICVNMHTRTNMRTHTHSHAHTHWTLYLSHTHISKHTHQQMQRPERQRCMYVMQSRTHTPTHTHILKHTYTCQDKRDSGCNHQLHISTLSFRNLAQHVAHASHFCLFAADCIIILLFTCNR